MVNKELVKTRFEKSLKTYDKNAVVQKQMAEFLMQKLIEHKGANFSRIFEIGCGTGLLTKKIRAHLHFDRLLLNDIVENLSASKLLIGDCEEIDFPSDLDLVISNAALQWVQDFSCIAEKIHSALKDKGIFAFTTFGKRNLEQIKKITGKTLDYYEQSTIEKLLSKNFGIVYSSSDIVNLEFDDVKDVLKHLKLCGVNSLEKTRWTKTDLKDFQNKYNEFKNKEGKFVLTYQPIYFIAQKR